MAPKDLKNIVMVAYTTYPSDARVRREAETMAAAGGYRVSVLVLKEHARPRRYRLGGVDVVELNLRKYRGKRRNRYFLSYVNFLVRACTEITRRFMRGRVDAVHAHNMPNFLVMAAIVPKLFGKLVILDIHDSMPETYTAKFDGSPNPVLIRMLQWEERISTKMADRVICVNHVQKEAIDSRERLTRPISVILNVPDPNYFMTTDAERENRTATEGFSIVYHGTITKRLGIDLAIQAVSLLRDVIPGMQFFVFGTGDDLEEFILLRNSLGLEDRVHFNGKMMPVEELLGHLTRMDLGLIANRRNIATQLMLPVKMLEYFALGIPVVAPRLKAIQHYCNDGMVSFYEPEQIDSMARVILALYADPARRCRQAASAGKFLNCYGWDRHKYELVNIYQS